MKKICILSAVNIKHMSLISLYTEKLNKKNIPFDIIYMDKYGIEESISAENKYVFKNIIRKKDNVFKKTIQYFRFKKFATPILEENNYDFIIVWNDVAIFMFAKYLSRKWRNKYCLNIRDYAKQDNFLLTNRYKKVIENSAFATISSEGFKEFLPSYNYVHVHSLNPEFIPVTDRNKFTLKRTPLKITFIGNIRFLDVNRNLLDIFKNDDRFILAYFGINANELRKYSEEKCINNVEFYDEFPVAETERFLRKMDLVNNLYGSNDKSLDYAISIKLYHGVLTGSPILANKNTYSGKLVEELGIGIAIDKIDKNLPDTIFNWYERINPELFNENLEKFKNKIKRDNEIFNQYFEKIITEK
ncbi:hypothetical protein [Sporosarcina luteola]|uniref:hypothetical protein n=1 Tax=Sporosarcina luteola TaxID=582850 RepID=UPI00203F8A69|nr:hypothetical protein [Sporosarcina luteola]MCM3709212.1 hypothetical protein [Sporosarcina luteola]